MKLNIPKPTIPTDWSPIVRAALMPVSAVLGLALIFLLIAASVRSSPSSSIRRSALVVGDSLSVGKFGEVVGNYLISVFGPKNVAVYASCGSSPENWLRSESTFYSKCGYREQTPRRTVVLEIRPHPVATPKLEELMSIYRPGFVIVQLGTNWMDRLAVGDTPQKEAEFSSILDRFIVATRSQRGSSPRVIWIMPPDSSHYSSRVQRTVEILISSAARRDNFETINSRELTHYVPGRSGSDGVHYNSQASIEWANRVIPRLNRRLRPAIVP
jgi:hypothetical protein